MLIPSLFALIPIIGAIPGVSIATATLIILDVRANADGTPTPVATSTTKKVSHQPSAAAPGLSVVRPYLRKLDRWTHPRLLILSEAASISSIPIFALGSRC